MVRRAVESVTRWVAPTWRPTSSHALATYRAHPHTELDDDREQLLCMAARGIRRAPSGAVAGLLSRVSYLVALSCRHAIGQLDKVPVGVADPDRLERPLSSVGAVRAVLNLNAVRPKLSHDLIGRRFGEQAEIC